MAGDSTGSSASSALNGGGLWQVSLPHVTRLPPATTPYGIVVTEPDAVTELDATTGRLLDQADLGTQVLVVNIVTGQIRALR